MGDTFPQALRAISLLSDDTDGASRRNQMQVVRCSALLCRSACWERTQDYNLNLSKHFRRTASLQSCRLLAATLHESCLMCFVHTTDTRFVCVFSSNLTIGNDSLLHMVIFLIGITVKARLSSKLMRTQEAFWSSAPLGNSQVPIGCIRTEDMKPVEVQFMINISGAE